MTPPPSEMPQQRRHVVGFFLSSIIVGIVGLVTAITMTTSGILNSFHEVSASYEDVFETGTEIGSAASSVDLDNASYAILSFSDSSQPPSMTEQAQACSVTDEHGDNVPLKTSTQPIADTEIATADYDLADTEHVVFARFEALQGTYAVSCQEFGLLSDGDSYSMGGTAIGGVVVGLASVVLAGILFSLGLLNHSRNRKHQSRKTRRVVDYRLDYL